MKKAFVSVLFLAIACTLFAQTASDYFNMAQQAEQRYDYRQAIELYEQAGELLLEAGRKDLYAITLNSIGSVYQDMGRYEEALEKYKQASSIAKEVGDEANGAVYLNNIAMVLKKQGRLEEAVGSYKQALAAAEKLGNKTLSMQVRSNIGVVYRAWGRYPEALEYYQSAAAIAEELGDRGTKAILDNNIGMVYDSLGDYEKAVEYYLRSLETAESTRNIQLTSVLYNNIGMVYRVWGRYDEAIEYFERVLELERRYKNREGIARTLNNMGGVYHEWGRYKKAIEYFEESLGEAEKLGNKDHIAAALNNTGAVFHDTDEYDKAVEYYSRALEIVRGLGKKAETAATLSNIGTVYHDWRKYREAVDFFRQALAVDEEIGQRGGIATDLNNIAGVYRSWEQYARAIEYYQKALKIDEELGRTANTANRLNNIGSVYHEAGQYAEAIDFFTRSVNLKEELRLTAAGPDRRDYLASQIYTYQFLISSAVRAGRPQKAFEAAEQSKARYLSEMIGSRLNLSEVPFRSAAEIQRELGSDEAILLYANISQNAPAVIAITGNAVTAVELYKPGFVKEVEGVCKDDMEFTLEMTRGLQISRPAQAKKPQDKTDDTDSSEGFSKIITYYRYLLTQPSPGASEREQLDFIGEQFYSFLIGPVERAIAGKKELLILPDGELGFLPFETFRNGNGDYLLENHVVRYTQSLAVSEMVSRRRYPSSRKPLCAFGGAIYEGGDQAREDGSEPVVLNNKEAEYAVTRGGESISDLYGRMGLRWSNLPGTLEEVRGIAELFPRASVYTGKEVTEPVVKRLSSEGN